MVWLVQINVCNSSNPPELTGWGVRPPGPPTRALPWTRWGPEEVPRSLSYSRPPNSKSWIRPWQSVSFTTNVVSSNPAHDVVYSIQHYVIKFVSDLWQVGGLLRVIRFPPPIKLTAKIT